MDRGEKAEGKRERGVSNRGWRSEERSARARESEKKRARIEGQRGDVRDVAASERV